MSYFNKRNVDVEAKYNFDGTSIKAETAKEIVDNTLSLFYSGEVDKIEIIYTRFESMISNVPSIRTLVPLQPTGMENEFDEIFELTTNAGKLTVDIKDENMGKDKEFSADTMFE